MLDALGSPVLEKEKIRGILKSFYLGIIFIAHADTKYENVSALQS